MKPNQDGRPARPARQGQDAGVMQDTVARSLSLRDGGVPRRKARLNPRPGWPDAGAGLAPAKDRTPAVLLAWRLAPDMLPLARQVQIAADLAKNGTARLADIKPPYF